MPAASSIIDPAARFARQIVLAGVGVSGQRRLTTAHYHFTGDPSIVEPAAAYVRAAGAVGVETVEDGAVMPGIAWCRVTPERGETVMFGAAARPGDARVGLLPAGVAALSVGVGSAPAGPGGTTAGRAPAGTLVSSPLADAGDLAEAGMLLAIEALRAGLGETPARSWGLGPSR